MKATVARAEAGACRRERDGVIDRSQTRDTPWDPVRSVSRLVRTLVAEPILAGGHVHPINRTTYDPSDPIRRCLTLQVGGRPHMSSGLLCAELWPPPERRTCTRSRKPHGHFVRRLRLGSMRPGQSFGLSHNIHAFGFLALLVEGSCTIQRAACRTHVATPDSSAGRPLLRCSRLTRSRTPTLQGTLPCP